MRKILTKMHDEEGQGLIEYGLILVLISIVCVIALTAIGNSVNSVFVTLSATL